MQVQRTYSPLDHIVNWTRQIQGKLTMKRSKAEKRYGESLVVEKQVHASYMTSEKVVKFK